MSSQHLGWFSIFRMGLVQSSLGAIVVLTTSTLNRVMIVEYALPAIIPGVLVALHYALQILRPRWGHGSDTGGRRTPWIIAGMACLAIGGIGAAVATAAMASHPVLGCAAAALAFTLVGVGVGATGTSLLALLATHVAPGRRAPAATVVWLMMIAGFVVTTIGAGTFLDPYSPLRLIAVMSAVCVLAFLIATVAVLGVEKECLALTPRDSEASGKGKADFKTSFAQVWSEPDARRFTVFIFVSMLAYSMQDLILEPFGGLVFGLSPAETTKLSGAQNAGVFLGMLLVALAANPRTAFGSLRAWASGGCIASAFSLLAIVWAAGSSDVLNLKAAIFTLGFSNGAYAVAAIGSMMALASRGQAQREGMRMGIWGASQALSFGAGGFCGTIAADLLRALLGAPGPAYAVVFIFEAALFVISAVLALRAIEPARSSAGGSGILLRSDTQLSNG